MQSAFPVTLHHAYAILAFGRVLTLIGLLFSLWSMHAAGVPPATVAVAVAVGLLVVAAVAEELWRRRDGPSEALLVMQATLNVAAAVGITWFTGAGGHPAMALLAVLQLPLAAAVSTRSSLAFALILCAAHHTVVAYAPDISDGTLTAQLAALQQLREVHQVVVFDFTVLAIAYFGAALRAMVERRDLLLQAALEERARTQRLVAIGTMSAGIAHELGTPLSSIDLLASEAMAEPAEAQTLLGTLRGEVSRCRGILDRLRGAASRTASPEVEALGSELAEWFADWRRAALGRGETALEVDPALVNVAVSGAADEWRGVVWSMLDNAQRAGGPVSARLSGDPMGSMQLTIDDAGPGPSTETLNNAGLAFFSGWADGEPGSGLGMYAARSFARRHDGDVNLERRAEGGGRIVIRWETISSANRKKRRR